MRALVSAGPALGLAVPWRRGMSPAVGQRDAQRQGYDRPRPLVADVEGAGHLKIFRGERQRRWRDRLVTAASWISFAQ